MPFYKTTVLWYPMSTERLQDAKEKGLVVLRIYVALAVFQPYRDLEAGNGEGVNRVLHVLNLSVKYLSRRRVCLLIFH